MNTCKTCRHRGEEGYCANLNLAERDCFEHDADKSVMLIYDYDEGGEFWVGENFGCIHHTAKTAEDIAMAERATVAKMLFNGKLK